MKRLLALQGDKDSLYKPDGTSVGTFSDRCVIPDDGATVNPLADLETDAPLGRVAPWCLGKVVQSGAGTSGGEFGSGNAGTAAGSFQSIDAAHVGERELRTGTTTTGLYTTSFGGSMFYLSSNSHVIEHEGVFFISTLSDGTNTFSVEFGFGDAGSNNTQANGAFVTHDANTDTHFKFITKHAGGTTTTTTTGVVVAINTRYRIRIRVTKDTKAECWITTDGVAFAVTPDATHTTNIPTGSAEPITARSRILKSAGTTSRSMTLWYESINQLVNAA